MKKAVLSAALMLLTTACLPLTLTPPAGPSPVVDNAGTAEALLKTAIVQTLTAQPTRTPVLVVSTETPTLTAEVLPSETMTPTAALTAETTVIDPAMIASTGTFDAATSTDFPALPAGSATATLTPAVLTHGTLPPAVPFSNITLINRAKTQAYISLQVVTAQGGPAILEYPVSGRIKIDAPVGQYLYVAWVGGRKMVGEFRLHRDEDLEITLYRDRVEIK